LLSSGLRLTGCGDRRAIEIGPCRVAPPVNRTAPSNRSAASLARQLR